METIEYIFGVLLLIGWVGFMAGGYLSVLYVALVTHFEVTKSVVSCCFNGYILGNHDYELPEVQHKYGPVGDDAALLIAILLSPFAVLLVLSHENVINDYWGIRLSVGWIIILLINGIIFLVSFCIGLLRVICCGIIKLITNGFKFIFRG